MGRGGGGGGGGGGHLAEISVTLSTAVILLHQFSDLLINLRNKKKKTGHTKKNNTHTHTHKQYFKKNMKKNSYQELWNFY